MSNDYMRQKYRKNRIEVSVSNETQNYYTYTQVSKDNLRREIGNATGSLTRIYRYRAVNEYNVSQLENNEIFGTKASEFNDPYDSSVKLDLNECHQLMKKNDPDISIEGIKSKILSFVEYIKNLFDIACFSETFNNPMMWSHYADKARGFVIEYDYMDLLNKVKDVYHVGNSKETYEEFFKRKHPIANINLVFYTDHTINLSDLFLKWYQENEMLDLVKKEEDLLRIINQVFYCKNSDWIYEREWRIIKLSDNKEKHIKMCNLRPKAIYLGEFIEPENKSKLIDIAKKHKLIIYQMCSTLESNGHTIKFCKVK